MKLTSMDINNKEFKKVLRGYNSEEVDEFMIKIADDYETLYKENSTLKESLNSMKERVDHHAKLEDTIQNTLILAQNAADQAKQNAQKEAELIIKNANETSQRLIEKAHNEVININENYDRLKQEFSKFRVKYKSFMKAQTDTFEDLEADFVKSYNVGSVVKEEIEEKEIEENAFNIKDLKEETFVQEDLNAIKSFFVEEAEIAE